MPDLPKEESPRKERLKKESPKKECPRKVCPKTENSESRSVVDDIKRELKSELCRIDSTRPIVVDDQKGRQQNDQKFDHHHSIDSDKFYDPINQSILYKPPEPLIGSSGPIQPHRPIQLLKEHSTGSNNSSLHNSRSTLLSLSRTSLNNNNNNSRHIKRSYISIFIMGIITICRPLEFRPLPMVLSDRQVVESTSLLRELTRKIEVQLNE